MEESPFSRAELLLGKEGIERLAKARVAVFGIGGVGGHAVEALARSGIGAFDLVDSDKVCVSNINRQIVATWETVGRDKVEVMKERILAINPAAVVETFPCFYLPETANRFDFSQYSYVVDAVDTVTAKVELVLQAQAAKIPIISCMGTGNKLDPTRLEVADLFQTSTCPLARVLRKELRSRGVPYLKVVYSREEAMKPKATKAESMNSCSREEQEKRDRKRPPGSVAFVPSVAGLILAAEVVKDLVQK